MSEKKSKGDVFLDYERRLSGLINISECSFIRDKIKEIFSMSSSELVGKSDGAKHEIIFDLARWSLQIQENCNSAKSKWHALEKIFNRLLYSQSTKESAVSLLEREATAITSNVDLQLLQQKIIKEEMRYNLYNNMSYKIYEVRTAIERSLEGKK